MSTSDAQVSQCGAPSNLVAVHRFKTSRIFIYSSALSLLYCVLSSFSLCLTFHLHPLPPPLISSVFHPLFAPRSPYGNDRVDEMDLYIKALLTLEFA